MPRSAEGPHAGGPMEPLAAGAVLKVVSTAPDVVRRPPPALATAKANLAQEKSMTDRPNFLLMVSDTFRRDQLGAYGNPVIRTPNLDAFARSSIAFDRHTVSSFPTMPARARSEERRVGKECRSRWSPYH